MYLWGELWIRWNDVGEWSLNELFAIHIVITPYGGECNNNITLMNKYLIFIKFDEQKNIKKMLNIKEFKYYIEYVKIHLLIKYKNRLLI